MHQLTWFFLNVPYDLFHQFPLHLEKLIFRLCVTFAGSHHIYLSYFIVNAAKKKTNYETLWCFVAWWEMQKQGHKTWKKWCEIFPIHYSFFTFCKHFRIFSNKCIASLIENSMRNSMKLFSSHENDFTKNYSRFSRDSFYLVYANVKL